jgi:hypothetical protein
MKPSVNSIDLTVFDHCADCSGNSVHVDAQIVILRIDHVAFTERSVLS